MEKIISGRAYKFSNNIDTDQIYPGRYLELTDAEDLAKHTLEGADPTFVKRFAPGGIVVAGTNFGCGSSREHAAITLQAAGIRLLIAESFARIFYRNCINLGLPLLVCPGIAKFVAEGNELKVDLEKGIVENISSEEKCQGEQISDYAFHILEAGGIKPLLRAQQTTG